MKESLSPDVNLLHLKKPRTRGDLSPTGYGHHKSFGADCTRSKMLNSYKSRSNQSDDSAARSMSTLRITCAHTSTPRKHERGNSLIYVISVRYNVGRIIILLFNVDNQSTAKYMAFNNIAHLRVSGLFTGRREKIQNIYVIIFYQYNW